MLMMFFLSIQKYPPGRSEAAMQCARANCLRCCSMKSWMMAREKGSRKTRAFKSEFNCSHMFAQCCSCFSKNVVSENWCECVNLFKSRICMNHNTTAMWMIFEGDTMYKSSKSVLFYLKQLLNFYLWKMINLKIFFRKQLFFHANFEIFKICFFLTNIIFYACKFSIFQYLYFSLKEYLHAMPYIRNGYSFHCTFLSSIHSSREAFLKRH